MRLTKKVVKRSVNIYMEFQEVTLVKKCREKMNKILFKRCVFTTSETNFFFGFLRCWIIGNLKVLGSNLLDRSRIGPAFYPLIKLVRGTSGDFVVKSKLPLFSSFEAIKPYP